MVRNLTGTLIEIARGRFPEDFLLELLASKGPFTGHCAPAHGLALLEVRYDGRRRTRIDEDMAE
jgi:tRNA pseudouridine38-40 synthase